MSNLPVELQREIFEIAVRSNYKDAALKLKLSLVAHHVHFWVDTVFYEIVMILGEASGAEFVELIDSKPSGFFGPVVKSLLLIGVGASICARILSKCTGIQSFAWWVLGRDDPTLAASQLPLQRLGLAFRDLAFLIAAHPPPIWLATLTHLETSISERSDGDLKQLRLFPRLTHVSLYAPKHSDSYAQMVIDNCPNLQILGMTLGTRDAAVATAVSLADSRIVVVLPDSINRPFEDWEAAHFGLPNLWTRAEDVLTERKRLATLEQSIDEK
ncbi:hypothetical protein MSAN_00558900 [Mycena sanguinolenta]|uniref:Uncharacterized protein n=1 Tax=Mycena sanguinolenta TaxID=230812 RepID=A0A8H6ZD46_9AGAR|nr:hypothetical protein MSAN_00558900 [Mycena sanguinolenta]